MVIYGTSAGAVLTVEVISRLKQLGLPQTAALGIFSGIGDLARNGDSISVFGGRGFTGQLDPPAPSLRDQQYVSRADPEDPVLSPVYSDLHGLPPTLFITSERACCSPRRPTCTAPTRTRRRCAPGDLRRSASRLLVQPCSAGIHRSQPHDDGFLCETARSTGTAASEFNAQKRLSALY
jgi:acetyl esterase/lipase